MSGLNCRPGDLAIIIGNAEARCVGKSVTCLRFVPKDTKVWETKSANWTTTSDSWFVDEDVWTAQYGDLMPGDCAHIVADRYLMPIRPLADPEDVTTEREVTA